MPLYLRRARKLLCPPRVIAYANPIMGYVVPAQARARFIPDEVEQVFPLRTERSQRLVGTDLNDLEIRC